MINFEYFFLLATNGSIWASILMTESILLTLFKNKLSIENCRQVGIANTVIILLFLISLAIATYTPILFQITLLLVAIPLILWLIMSVYGIIKYDKKAFFFILFVTNFFLVIQIAMTSLWLQTGNVP